jgi:cyclopropane-fatty-acyl-phospholipid synthase
MAVLPLHGRPVAGHLEPLLRHLDPLDLEQRPFAVEFWDGSELPATEPPAFRLLVRSPNALAHIVVQRGELGLARAWVSGALDVEGDLDAAFSTLRRRMTGVHLGPREWLRFGAAVARVGALRRPPIPATETRFGGRVHSLRRDRAAVRHHYDVPTEFYRLVLGPSLVYSCAYFASPDDTLERAQEHKLEMICRKLDLREGERFLDVGCGWGSLVIHAAQRHGVRATGVTLSPSQAAEARRRIAEAGLQDRCRIEVLDYRELQDGPYDKIASVGMYEHVGQSELGGYVARLRELLRPGGRLLNHGIAALVPRPTDRPTFINRYVFPDGELHPIGELLGVMDEVGFELRHVETLREHYANTLRRWVANLERNHAQAARLAGGERERIWRLYMTAAAQAFDEGELGVYQTLAVRPAGAPFAMPQAGSDVPTTAVRGRRSSPSPRRQSSGLRRPERVRRS